MDRKLHVEIVTPYGMFFEGDAEQLVLPALDGEIGICPGHAPIIIALTPGEMRITVQDQVLVAAITDGFAHIEMDNAVVCAGSVEKPEEIDKERAERSILRAKERMKKPGIGKSDLERSERGILRAKARLKVAEKVSGTEKVSDTEKFSVKKNLP